MTSKRVSVSGDSNSMRSECSVAAVSERLFERTLTFAEIVDLSEKCGLWDVGRDAKKPFSHPLAFVVPAIQSFASVSRIVE
jgi:hypothetical protein